jgi:hypothetical protein
LIKLGTIPTPIDRFSAEAGCCARHDENGSYWSRHFREVFIRQLQLLADTLLTRVLPAFEGLETEAEQIKETEYARLGALPASDDSFYDMADAAEDAFDV